MGKFVRINQNEMKRARVPPYQQQNWLEFNDEETFSATREEKRAYVCYAQKEGHPRG